MKPLIAAAALSAALLLAPAALACTPLLATDPVTGETYGSGSPEWLRREQVDWRAQADAVVFAQARAARMVSIDETEFIFTPITTVYGEPLPEGNITFRWRPGNTCNTFILGVADFVVVYVIVDEAGARALGVIPPQNLQDRPADFLRRLREIRRGLPPGPPFAE